jgi:hypothetical protein
MESTHRHCLFLKDRQKIKSSIDSNANGLHRERIHYANKKEVDKAVQRTFSDTWSKNIIKKRCTVV